MRSLEHVTPGAIVVDESQPREELTMVLASQLDEPNRTATVLVCGTNAWLEHVCWWLVRPCTLDVIVPACVL